MARAFALAGLLRLRHLQQDQAAGDLAAANALSQANLAQRAQARSVLAGLPALATGADTLAAIAAARASARSMLAEMEAHGRNYQVAVGEARQEFDARRAASVGLEKLSDRHAVVARAEELHAEQAVLDEIASSSWHRARGGDRA
ncbi:MAG: hypothetical protein H7311_02605 [Ramlibacter sp.]|nr:hypothetical protein [Cryobacterium sp.]